MILPLLPLLPLVLGWSDHGEAVDDDTTTDDDDDRQAASGRVLDLAKDTAKDTVLNRGRAYS